MRNNFRNGYTCKKCVTNSWQNAGRTMTPLYFRENGKFVFAGLVKCPQCGITEAIALRDL